MQSFRDFFRELDQQALAERTGGMLELFSDCFTYQWHNQWQAPELRFSIAGAYNRLVNDMLVRRYALSPCPSFES